MLNVKCQFDPYLRGCIARLCFQNHRSRALIVGVDALVIEPTSMPFACHQLIHEDAIPRRD